MVLNRRGITAVVDAMFFIILIGMAVSVISHTIQEDVQLSRSDHPSDVCDAVFMSDITADDYGFDSSDGKIMSVADLTAISVASGDDRSKAYLEGILDELYPWKDAYTLTVAYGDSICTLGTGYGVPSEGCTAEYALSFGGSLRVHLDVY